jgi:hypothetical protein
MQGPYLRKYGVETTIPFVLFETDGINFKTDAAHAAGDTKIMKDEGAEANTANAFVDEGQGYSITLSATEMEAARIVVYVADQSTKVWLDTAIAVETYGNASAMHEFDLDTAAVTVTDITQRQIPDSIPADGTRPTIEQALYLTVQYLCERSVSGTTLTVKKVDGSTTLATFTLDNGTDPTSHTRAT